MISEKGTKIVCDEIDHLVISQIGTKFRKFTDVLHIPALYDATTRKLGDPLSCLSARELIDRVKLGAVLCAPGWFLAQCMAGETDGPSGVATLARAIDSARYDQG